MSIKGQIAEAFSFPLLFAGKFTWAPLRYGLDALTMVLRAHQPVLLDELYIGLRFHRLCQTAADSSASGDQS